MYETTSTQLTEVLAGWERVLREHPAIWSQSITVRFVGFGESSLDVEITAWFVTSDWNQFLIWRQEVLIAFMAVVERAGSGFAFPTRTLHLAGGWPSAEGAPGPQPDDPQLPAPPHASTIER